MPVFPDKVIVPELAPAQTVSGPAGERVPPTVAGVTVTVHVPLDTVGVVLQVPSVA